MGVLSDWQLKRDVKVEPMEDAIRREGKISWGVGSYGIDMRVGYVFKVFSPINATEIDPKNFDERCLVTVDLTPKYEHHWEDLECLDANHNPTIGKHCAVCGAWKDTPSEHKYQCPKKQPNYILIPPHSFALGESVEYFEIPRDTLCIVIGKSTYARCGIVVNCTPLEPEWKGKVTIEISNTTPLPARIYCGEGIAQCVFIRSDGCIEKRSDFWGLQVINGLKLAWSEQDEEDEKKLITEGTCQVSYADKRGRYQNQTGITLPSADKTS